MRISYWSSYVCSSDLQVQLQAGLRTRRLGQFGPHLGRLALAIAGDQHQQTKQPQQQQHRIEASDQTIETEQPQADADHDHQRYFDANQTRMYRQRRNRSEEHTSELQSLMRISYAVFCLKK